MSIVARPLGDSSLLNDMLANAPKFGEPIVKGAWASGSGTREVIPGPRSPPPSRRHLVNGYGHTNGVDVSRTPKQAEHTEAGPSTSTPAPPSSTLSSNISSIRKPFIGPQIPSSHTLPSPITTPSRKGKEKSLPSSPAISSSQSAPVTPRATKPGDQLLYNGTIELTWPSPIASQKSAPGLYNPSMACYANATLQVLLHTPPVLHMALAHDPNHCLQASRKSFCMLCVLKRLVESEHWTGKRKAYLPRDVHGNLSNIKKGFSKNRQEDTHEFFRFVTDALQNSVLLGKPKDLPIKIKHSTWVYQTWGGEVRSRVVCLRCKKPSDTFDSFLDLSLDVNKGGPRTVERMLQGFIREDKLEGDNKYHCENCKAKTNASKSFRIAQAPPILTLHLKRFSVNYNSYSGRARADKFTEFIAYPEVLSIADYMVDKSMPGTTYRLFGVTCHRGVELRFGHYTSYVKSPQGTWFHADDEDMMSVPREQVLREKTAYLLSYIRVDGDTLPAASQSSQVATSSPAVRSDHHSEPPSSTGFKRKRAADDELEESDGSNVKQPRREEPTSSPIKGRAGHPNGDVNYEPASPVARPPPRSSSQPNSPPAYTRDSEGEDDATPDLFPSKFAAPKSKHSLLNGHSAEANHLHAPQAHSHATQISSPIQRPNHPPPRTPDGSGKSKKQKKKERLRQKLEMEQMRRDPFKLGGASPGGFKARGNGGFRNLAPGQKEKMSGKRPNEPLARKRF